MPIQAKVNDHVFCPRLGEGEFKVLRVEAREYHVKSILTGVAENVYQALCHITPPLAVANSRRRKAVAETIGRPSPNAPRRKR